MGVAAGAGVTCPPAAAQSGAPARPDIARPDVGGPDAAQDLWQRGTLLGDFGGARTRLDEQGVSVGLLTTNEIFANMAGGIRRGASGNGVTTLSLGLDTAKAFGLEGGTFNVTGLWTYGPGFTQTYVGALQTVSGIAAQPSVRLWELWYQQAVLAGKADIKFGQQSVDQEFVTSAGSGLFLNAAMGWPATPSADMYGGGPAFPLSSLGVRLRARPTDAITLLAGVFDDNPPGGPFRNDPQSLGTERHGTRFNLGTGALMIAELQYAVNQPPLNQPVGDTRNGTGSGGLPGTYKVGVWFDTATFPDQRFDDAGRSLADPNSTGRPQSHSHNYSVYAVIDQTIWQPDPQAPHAVSVFVRPMVAPADRNLIDFSVNGGVTVKAPLPERANDTFGIGFGVANVSARASGLDRDTIAFSGGFTPVRGAETFIEVTWQAQITPWLQVQPDFQYFWMPGGGVPSPGGQLKRIGNATVFGLRSAIVF